MGADFGVRFSGHQRVRIKFTPNHTFRMGETTKECHVNGYFYWLAYNQCLIRLHVNSEIQLTIKISKKTEQHFSVTLAPLSSISERIIYTESKGVK